MSAGRVGQDLADQEDLVAENLNIVRNITMNL
jgi:hypothetical protein